MPGPLCVFGDKAMPVVAGKSGENLREAVVAATRLGAGRAVAFGHDGYFDAATLAVADTGRFMLNAVRWAELAYARLTAIKEFEQDPNCAAGHIACRFNAQGPNFNTLTACAASTQALVIMLLRPISSPAPLATSVECQGMPVGCVLATKKAAGMTWLTFPKSVEPPMSSGSLAIGSPISAKFWQISRLSVPLRRVL